MITYEQLAEAIHGLTRLLKRTDGSEIPAWTELPEPSRKAAVDAVQELIDWEDWYTEELTPEMAHQVWQERVPLDWKYGEVYCAINKTHPCLVPFDELPYSEQVKDEVWVTVINLMKPFTHKQ